MVLRLRLRCIAFSVLFLLALAPVQVVTPTVHAKDNASHPTCDTECSKNATEKMKDAEALSCVLATIATKLDKREKKLTKEAREHRIPVKIDRRAPIDFNKEELCSVQKQLERLALGQLRQRGGCTSDF